MVRSFRGRNKHKKGDEIEILGANYEYVTTSIIKAKKRQLPKYLQISHKTL